MNIGCLWVLSTSVYRLLRTLVHSSFYPLPRLPIFSSCFSVFLSSCFPEGSRVGQPLLSLHPLFLICDQSILIFFFLSHRLIENSRILAQADVNLPVLSWWWGCHLLGIRLPLLSMAFPPQQLVSLSRLYSVTRASSVLTGSATRRWGWCLGRRGYISSQGASHHFPFIILLVILADSD